MEWALKKILASDCFIYDILQVREDFLSKREVKVYKNRPREEISKLSPAQELKVDDFITNGRPGKAIGLY